MVRSKRKTIYEARGDSSSFALSFASDPYVIVGLLIDGRFAISERVLETRDPEDYARREVVRAHQKLDGATTDDFSDQVDQTSAELPHSRFKAYSLSELRNFPPLEYLLEGIIRPTDFSKSMGGRRAARHFLPSTSGCASPQDLFSTG